MTKLKLITPDGMESVPALVMGMEYLPDKETGSGLDLADASSADIVMEVFVFYGLTLCLSQINLFSTN